MKKHNMHQKIVGSLSGVLFLIFFFSSFQKIINGNSPLLKAVSFITLFCAALSFLLYSMNNVKKAALSGIISSLGCVTILIVSGLELKQYPLWALVLLICSIGLSIGGYLPLIPPFVRCAHSSKISHFRNSNITGDTYEQKETCRFKVLDNDPRYIICLNCGHENFCSYKFCQNCNKEFIT